MTDTWAFLGGAASMAGFLMLIGVTKSRGMSTRAWTAVWTGGSLAFAALLLGAFLVPDDLLMALAHGAAFGYVASVGVHTLHHYLDERRRAGATPGTAPRT